MKKILSILLVISIVLCIGSAFAENIYYWDITNTLGVLYKVDYVINEERYDCPTVNSSTINSSRDCQYYYTAFDKLTVIADINNVLANTVVYGLRFSFVNKDWETIDTTIDGNEFDLFGLFLEEASKNGCSYTSCDGTVFEVYNGTRHVRIYKEGVVVFMSANDLITNSIAKLNAAKSAK